MSELTIQGISKSFGGLQALDDVSLTATSGRVTSLIGPNGAGKTTIFNCITGELEPDSGRVELDGRELTGLPTHERADAGLGRTFQRLEVFSNMTVFENLQVAAEARHPAGMWRDLLRYRQRTDPDIAARVEEVLTRIGLDDVGESRAGDLSTGRLRLLEIGRALCTEPTVLLLDEPASGLDSEETVHLETLLRGLADEGYGVLLIEHDVELVLSVSEHVFCLDFGKIIADGPPDAIAADPQVRAAYLGVDRKEADAAPAGA